MITRKLILNSLVLSIVFMSVASTSAFAQTTSPVGLPDLKLRACLARELAIKGRMNSLVNLVTNMETKFDSITKRVEDFYTNKVVPTGKTVSNYDSLVTDIKAKKEVVQSDLNKTSSDISSFSCSASDPKSLYTKFKTDMQTVKTDLQNYRQSIKNLIVAVRGKSPTPAPESGK